MVADQDFRIELERRRSKRQTPVGAGNPEWARLIHDGLAMHSGRPPSSDNEKSSAAARPNAPVEAQGSPGMRRSATGTGTSAGSSRRRARVAPTLERGRVVKQTVGLTASMVLATALVFGAGYMLSQNDETSALEERVAALGIDVEGQQPGGATPPVAPTAPAEATVEPAPEIADATADTLAEEAIAANPVGAARSLIPQVSPATTQPDRLASPETPRPPAGSTPPPSLPPLLNQMSVAPSVVHFTAEDRRPPAPTL